MHSTIALPILRFFTSFPLLILAASVACAGIGQIEMVDVGGYKLQCCVIGSGSPAVVFLNGGSATMDYWDNVAEIIFGMTTVITYERAGHQDSELGREPRHGKNIVYELKALLEALSITGPHIFVAHSAGCMYARIFVNEFPGDVSGMVLLDPGDKDVLDRFAERFLSSSDRTRWTKYWVATWHRLAERPDGFGKEIQHKEETIAQMRDEIFPVELDLFVLSAADKSRPHYYLADYGAQVTEDFYAFVLDYHQSLVEDMPAGKHIPVDDASHVIHRDRPDLVISLVRSLLESSLTRISAPEGN